MELVVNGRNTQQCGEDPDDFELEELPGAVMPPSIRFPENLFLGAEFSSIESDALPHSSLTPENFAQGRIVILGTLKNWQGVLIMPSRGVVVQGDDKELDDFVGGQARVEEVPEQAQEALPMAMPSLIHHPRSDTQPQIIEFMFMGMLMKCVGLPAFGCEKRACCGQAWPSEMKRLIGLFAVVGGISSVLAVIANIIVGVLKSTSNHPAQQNGTDTLNGTNVPLGPTKGPTSPPLAYSGPTSIDSINLFLLVFGVIAGIGALYFGMVNLFCVPTEEPKKNPV